MPEEEEGAKERKEERKPVLEPVHIPELLPEQKPAPPALPAQPPPAPSAKPKKGFFSFLHKEPAAPARKYPSFAVLPQNLTELPKEEPLVYPLISPYCHASIKRTEEGFAYTVDEPALDENEKKLYSRLQRTLAQVLDVAPSQVKNEAALLRILEQKFQLLLEDFGIKLADDAYLRMMYFVYRDFMGLNEAEPLLRDPFIEDISCDGVGVNIFVVHRRYGSLRTNIVFSDAEKLKELVTKFAEKCGRYISYATPLLDGTLPDGTRVQATLAGDVTTRGPTFSIRKFPEIPFTPLDVLRLNTASTDMLAYLWQLIEGGANMLVIGATATGKTSMLNSVAFFMPPEAKVVSIEDTRELNIMHENWLPGVARVSFSGTTVGEVTMYDLLKEAFRQNPNYLIVGEVRGEEANVMFHAMASGITCLSTMHAGSPDDALKRLQMPPISIPASIVETLDAIIVMSRAQEVSSNARRISSIVEVEEVSSETRKPSFREIFAWDPATDSFARREESAVIRKISAGKGISMEQLEKSVVVKAELLQSLLLQGLDWKGVAQAINSYYAGKKAIFIAK